MKPLHAAIGLLLLLSVGGIAAAEPPVPGQFYEAPMLAERVASGDLPPVEQRLPEPPAVVEPVERIGVYGGTWRRAAMGSFDIGLQSRLGYEPLVRWNRDGLTIVPGLAKSWDVKDAGRTYVFHLRKGLRWSDGAPFTSEDILFTFDFVYANAELTPVYPAWLLSGGPPKVSAPDPHTVVFEYAEPYGLFLEYQAFRGAGILMPKHYLKQFHPDFTDAATLERRIHEGGHTFWYQLFTVKENPDINPDLPTMNAFVIREPPPAARAVAERNPYYWKVDPAGNQLPYIDQIAYTMVESNEIANFRAMTGGVDFQARRIDPANYGLFMENREKGGYRVLADTDPAALLVYINQYSKDPVRRILLQNRDFRVALSIAINREELIEFIYGGLATPSNGVAAPMDPFYEKDWGDLYTEYDPAGANEMLDELGMKLGRDGLRTLPDGSVFRPILNVFPAETGASIEMWQLVADYWREVGLDFAVKLDAQSLSVLNVQNGNSDFWAYANEGLHWIVDPVYYVPWESVCYYAPLFGRYRSSGSKSGVKPTTDCQQIIDWYAELRGVYANPERRLELGRNILRQNAVESYTVGICHPTKLTIVSKRMHNVPDHILHCWTIMTPGYLGIEQFFVDE
ncbi:MAG: ABC transporter substrate-binding protein [Candidatus Hydrogenedentes bacterium]|nr:ABC transporter substrate-binding protein [Candidatus Hydrogenedentota bacterium]